MHHANVVPGSFVNHFDSLICRISTWPYQPHRLSIQNWSFLDSWKVTQNHQILMMVVVAIFPFVISIPEKLLSHAPHIDLLVNLLSAVTMVFVVAALSVAFQVITKKGDES